MPETAARLRDRVIREITVAPGWNKEDATALVDELILSLPYIDDKNATRDTGGLDAEGLRRWFMERGWSIHMADNEHAVDDPFVDLAAHLETPHA